MASWLLLPAERERARQENWFTTETIQKTTTADIISYHHHRSQQLAEREQNEVAVTAADDDFDDGSEEVEVGEEENLEDRRHIERGSKPVKPTARDAD